jgi:hypothetical protein
MRGGTIRGNARAGLAVRGVNAAFEKTGGIIYGNTAAANSKNDGPAIAVVSTTGGPALLELWKDAVANVTYKVRLNAAGNGIASQEPSTW